MISLEGVKEETLPPSIYASGKRPPTQTRNGLEDKAPPRKKNEDLKKCTQCSSNDLRTSCSLRSTLCSSNDQCMFCTLWSTNVQVKSKCKVQNVSQNN